MRGVRGGETMRIATLVCCGALLAGCGQISGAPSVPQSPTNLGAAPPGRDSSGQYYSSLYSFNGKANGGSPQAGLVSYNGELYGTTSSYGKGYGTVFKVDAFGKVTLLHTFTGYPDGAYPMAGLIWYKNAFYGTTSAGGAHGGGTVFEMAPSGAVRVLHSFGKGADGAQPESALVEYGDIFFGTTLNGGSKNRGTAYEVAPNGDERVMHSFTGSRTDGSHPSAGLTVVKGIFYGVTRAGGKNAGGGTAFKMSAFGVVQVLHSFKVQPGDGSNPAGTLLYLGGIFYGTTLHGGSIGRGYGTVFEMNADGVEGVMHSFGANSDGAFPSAGLVSVSNELYGTTTGGGSGARKSNECISSGVRYQSASYYKCGTIFEIDKAGKETVVYRFEGYPDGANPEASLTVAGDVLYGTTDWGGTSTYYGTIFSFFP